jgi:tRNA(fMet)-specific endonuclease VapC
MASSGQVNSTVSSYPGVVVDTCIVSFIFKGDTRRAAYEGYLIGTILVVSPMTVAELDRWALSANWGAARRYALEQELRRYVVHPFTRALCLKWAEAVHSARRTGFSVSCADAWIAASALLLDIPLITHNGDDFRGIDGLHVISRTSMSEP